MYKANTVSLLLSCCEEKVEHDQLKVKLKQTLDMLEYAHSTSEQYYDHRKVSEFIGEMSKYLGEM